MIKVVIGITTIALLCYNDFELLDLIHGHLIRFLSSAG